MREMNRKGGFGRELTGVKPRFIKSEFGLRVYGLVLDQGSYKGNWVYYFGLII